MYSTVRELFKKEKAAKIDVYSNTYPALGEIINKALDKKYVTELTLFEILEIADALEVSPAEVVFNLCNDVLGYIAIPESSDNKDDEKED